MPQHTSLYPRLIVADPVAALAFYKQCFGADIIEHFTDDQGRVVHAAFSVFDAIVSLAQAVPQWGLTDPLSLGGSPCLLHLTVDDPDQIANSVQQNGGQILIAIEDRPYGKREGRVSDPSGHLWILSKTIEDIDADEIRRRLDSA